MFQTVAERLDPAVTTLTRFGSRVDGLTTTATQSSSPDPAPATPCHSLPSRTRPEPRSTIPARVRFYVRGQFERTFETDPAIAAQSFLDHRLGQRATASRHAKYYIDRFLATYLERMGAGWARVGDSDPHRTRWSYDAVRRAVDALLTASAGDVGITFAGPLIDRHEWPAGGTGQSAPSPT